jgi:transcriptional regulator GlxA family with amidase domain
MSGQLLKVHDWQILARKANFRPAGMAAMCSISLRQLERHFQCCFHRTPGEWTRDLRLRLAKDLIGQGWSNKAVAAELNFANESHLCHEFMRVYGLPPRSFAPAHLKAENVAFSQ